MGLAAALFAGLASSCALAYGATHVATRAALRMQFLDRPGGHKGHDRATPYLGGSAVIVAFALACLSFAGSHDRTVPVLIGGALMWGVGTADDRRDVAWQIRVAAEVVAASVLFTFDLSWELGLGGSIDYLVTVLWVIGVVNALNLMDNMDGQAATMGAVIAGAVAVLGALEGDRWLAVAGATLCGACLGFLPHNLARPARIFLGDGGSMPIGFVLASLVMAGAHEAAGDWHALAMGVLLVGVPAIDSILVTISRHRRGISVLTGGRDHLTHRLRQRLGTARAVAVVLGSAQAFLAALAVAAGREGPVATGVAAGFFVVAAGAAVLMLDRR